MLVNFNSSASVEVEKSLGNKVPVAANTCFGELACPALVAEPLETLGLNSTSSALNWNISVKGLGVSLLIENEKAGPTKGEERMKPVDTIAVNLHLDAFQLNLCI